MAKTIFYKLRKRLGVSKAIAGAPVVSASYVNSVEDEARQFLPLVYLCTLRDKLGMPWEELGALLDDEFLPFVRTKSPPPPDKGEEE